MKLDKVNMFDWIFVVMIILVCMDHYGADETAKTFELAISLCKVVHELLEAVAQKRDGKR